jgi:hypothetical protein
MHESCFESWEHRDAMVRKYRIACGEICEAQCDPATNIVVLGIDEDRRTLLDRLRRHAKPLRAPDVSE